MWWMRSSCARAEVEENQEVCMLYWHHGTGVGGGEPICDSGCDGVGNTFFY